MDHAHHPPSSLICNTTELYDNVAQFICIYFALIVPPHFNMGEGLVISRPPVIIATCGQDVEISSFTGLIIFQLRCPLFNGTRVLCGEPQQIRGFKDGVEISIFTGTVLVGPFRNLNEDICGTYTFVIENACGRDVKTSRVFCPGMRLLMCDCLL